MNHNLSCFNFHSHFKLSLSQNKIKSNFRIPHKLSAVGAKFSRTKHKSVPAGTWIHHAALHSCFHLTSNYRALLFKCDFFFKGTDRVGYQEETLFIFIFTSCSWGILLLPLPY